MKLKKLFAGVVAVAMMATMAFPAFAEGKEVVPSGPSIKKTYKLTNAGTVSPTENFTFTAVATKVLHAGMKNGQPVTAEDAPALTIAQAEYGQGNATVDGSDKVLAVSPNEEFPNVGVYYYTVTENASTYAGVTTQTGNMLLKVTVAYDEHDQLTKTYAFYTATNENGEGQGTKNQAVENTYSAGTLDVSKKVTGSLGDKSKKFDVDVTFTAPEDKTVEAPITYTENDVEKKIEKANWVNGSAKVTIHLAHGEHIVFNNIPYDVTYTVVEADYTTEANGGYDTASYNFSDKSDIKKLDSAAETVEITNNNGAMIDTGVILDNAPYMLMLAVVAGGAMTLVIKKRREEE